MLQNIVKRKPRKFLKEDYVVETWAYLKPYYEDLLNRTILSKLDLLEWIKNRSELDAVVEENYCWRYINKTRDTTNETYEQQYKYFIENIEPHRMAISNKLDKKVIHSPFLEKLDEKRFDVYKRKLKNNIDLFRPENIDLFVQEEQTQNNYHRISSLMTIEYNGKEITLQQASAILDLPDREQRAIIHQKMIERRLLDKDALNVLFNELRAIRHKIAQNAGFDNYREFKLRQLGRFDYGVTECEQFHNAIEHSLIPLIDNLMEQRRKYLGLTELKPYDLQITLGQQKEEIPFNGSEDLISKTIECLHQIDPYFSQCLEVMRDMGHLDLESRKGKAPGGYNCPLPEIGVPYIFMNAANSPKDLKTIIHEGGHAVHSFLMADLDYNFDKRVTSEAAELASMSMEMFSLTAYDIFYPDETERKEAIHNLLESSLISLPWIALIDKFQHWIYTHPNHTDEERTEKWSEFHQRFSSKIVDWSNNESYRDALWQQQLHVFMAPFYYIEYGIARLGSIALYRNFKKDSKSTIQSYKSALSMGYTLPLPKIYEKAEIQFDFSLSYIKELVEFMKKELN